MVKPEGWLEVIRPFSEGLAAVQTLTHWGFIDHSGKYVVEPQFDGVWNFSEGLAGFRIEGKFGFIGRDGKLMLKIGDNWPVLDSDDNRALAD